MKDKNIKNNILFTLIAIYAVSAICCNLFSVKPLSFSFPFIVMDGGLLVSWIPFFVSNIITETYGKESAKSLTISMTIVSLCVSILAVIISFIPTLPIYEEQAKHFAFVFDNSIRVTVASLLSFFLANIAHISILDNLKKHTKNDNNFSYLFRTFISGFLGQFIDNGVFEFLAFAKVGLTPFEMGLFDIFTATLCSTIIEMAFHMIFITIFAQYVIKKIK